MTPADCVRCLSSHNYQSFGIMRATGTRKGRVTLGIRNGSKKMNTLEKQDIKSYLDGLGVKFSAREDWNDYAPEIWESSFHYRVKISYEGRTMGLWFYMGRGNKNAPTLDGVMECLISDAICARNGLKDFGDEFGWDENTTKTFQAIKKNTTKIVRVFGVDVLEKLEEIIYA